MTTELLSILYETSIHSKIKWYITFPRSSTIPSETSSDSASQPSSPFDNGLSLTWGPFFKKATCGRLRWETDLISHESTCLIKLWNSSGEEYSDCCSWKKSWMSGKSHNIPHILKWTRLLNSSSATQNFVATHTQWKWCTCASHQIAKIVDPLWIERHMLYTHSVVCKI